MTVGLIDVDAESRGKVTFPNLPLMKLSAWHKAHGDEVGWYDKTGATHYDRVYLARVFGDEYTHEYEGPINADEIIRGGRDMRFMWGRRKSTTAKLKTLTCRKRSIISCRITACTGLRIPPMDS